MTDTSLRPPATSLSLSELAALVRAYAEDPDSWRALLRYPAPGADRWWTRLESAEGVDVWLLSWLPGHTTEFHDHGASAAAFAVVEGGLTEVRATRSGRVQRHRRRQGSIATVPVGDIHDVIAEDRVAVSIHAYSPPLESMTYYATTATGDLAVLETVVTDDPEEGPRR